MQFGNSGNYDDLVKIDTGTIKFLFLRKYSDWTDLSYGVNFINSEYLILLLGFDIKYLIIICIIFHKWNQF